MDYVKNEVKLRRELHQIPELGWGEFCTTAKILETIEPLGWKTYAGVEQVGLDAVMGRPEDFVEKSKQRALEEGVDPKLIERMHGYTGTIAELDTGKPGPVTGLSILTASVLKKQTSKTIFRTRKTSDLVTQVSCIPADMTATRP